jgi:ubiquitin-conjugating enzyme E2 J2
MCIRRLKKELMALQKDPIREPVVQVVPNEKNLLEMHYVLEGSAGTPYEGGIYHGKLVFPADYPMKPPGVLMMTPNGRFRTNCKLCLSMSDFHPETWNPLWSVGTIITGLYSFMIETTPTAGSIETTLAKKRVLAKDSLAWNCQPANNPMFIKLFPEYVEKYRLWLEEEAERKRIEEEELRRRQAEAAPLITGGEPHHAHLGALERWVQPMERGLQQFEQLAQQFQQQIEQFEQRVRQWRDERPYLAWRYQVVLSIFWAIVAYCYYYYYYQQSI